MLNIIYALKNKINNKIYIGQTWQSLKERWSHGYKNCTKIQRALNKYGKKLFYYEVLTFCSTQEVADFWEQYFIQHYDSINNGYNLKNGGSAGKHSKETKTKISKSSIGKQMSLEARNKMSVSKRGRSLSEDTKNKMSLSRVGKKHSEDSRNKISLSLSGKLKSLEHRLVLSQSKSGDKHYFFGQTHSQNTKNKISAANSGDRNGNSKLSAEDVLNIKKLLLEYPNITSREISLMFNVSAGCIRKIMNNSRWAHIKIED